MRGVNPGDNHVMENPGTLPYEIPCSFLGRPALPGNNFQQSLLSNLTMKPSLPVGWPVEVFALIF
jgi:hypothetical protein